MKKHTWLAATVAAVLLLGAGCADVEAVPGGHVHDWGEWSETAPTCTADGSRERVCKTDPTHVERETVPALGHAWSKAWTWDETVHYHVCERGCGARNEEGAHIISRGACSVCGYTLTPSELTYEEVLGEDGSTVVGYAVTGWDDSVTDRHMLVVPETHAERPVIAIADNAFYADDGDGDETLQSVFLAESVKTIGEYAFYGCVGLANIEMQSVTTVAKGAFYGCTGLLSATLGSLETLGDYAFYRCTSMRSLSVEGVENFGAQVFQDCPALTSASFGDGVTELGSYAFYTTENLRTVSFGKAFTQPIVWDTFPMEHLERIEVSGENAVYASADGVLYNKAKTQLVLVPYAYKGKVDVCEGVTEIGSNKALFLDHKYVTAVTLPSTLTTLAGDFIRQAFKGCNRLAEVCNLSGIDVTQKDDFGDGNLYGLAADVVVRTQSEASVVSEPDADGFVWQTKAGQLIAYFGEASALVLPADYHGSAYTVRDSALAACGFTSLTVPAGVVLGESACSNCADLAEVTLEEGVTEIGEGAFKSCSALTTVHLPKSLKTVGGGAFVSCDALKEAYYAGTVSEYAAITFGNNYATVFNTGSEPQATLYCAGLALPEKIVIEGVEEIGAYAFCGAPVTSAVVGKGVKRIGQSAFSNSMLESVVLGKDLVKFSNAFSNSALQTAFFEGTQEDWDALNAEFTNASVPSGVTVYYLTDAADGGKGWHYGADGSPEIW